MQHVLVLRVLLNSEVLQSCVVTSTRTKLVTQENPHMHTIHTQVLTHDCILHNVLYLLLHAYNNLQQTIDCAKSTQITHSNIMCDTYQY